MGLIDNIKARVGWWQGNRRARAWERRHGVETGKVKSIFRSVTVWGALLAAVGPYAARHGMSLDPGLAPAFVDISEQVITLIGLMVTVWGRMRATQPVGIVGGKP